VIERSLTKKSKLPAVAPDPKVKCFGVLSKSMKTPPFSIPATIPESFVTSTLPGGVVPGGAANEASRSK
jgi:hypothetical protein